MAGEDGGSVIFSIFSIRTGSLGSCYSGMLTSGAATEAGGDDEGQGEAGGVVEVEDLVVVED